MERLSEGESEWGGWVYRRGRERERKKEERRSCAKEGERWNACVLACTYVRACVSVRVAY